MAMMSPLILKRGEPSRRRDNDYDVLEDGKVVGRIFHLEAVPPEGRPRMWASGHGGHIERAAHGYEATREAGMAAFAKSWRRKPGDNGERITVFPCRTGRSIRPSLLGSSRTVSLYVSMD
jgi:hypothetical protein